ncbi:MAG TPA: Uma2 family endonuclease [Verrucomicrobiae bacterium]
MSRTYEEIIEGNSVHRTVLGGRHRLVLERLHALVRAALPVNGPALLQEPRSTVQLRSDAILRPDLSLVTAATGKVFIAAEIISSEDHRWDTVTKKEIYEDCKIPRLWMIDLRYDNVEVYHGSQYGLGLKGILASKEVLTEKLLPNLSVSMNELFSD